MRQIYKERANTGEAFQVDRLSPASRSTIAPSRVYALVKSTGDVDAAKLDKKGLVLGAQKRCARFWR